MPKGLIKASGYYNNLEARRDWGAICTLARERNISPPEIDSSSLSHKKLDKLSAKLLAQMGLDWEGYRTLVKQARSVA